MNITFSPEACKQIQSRYGETPVLKLVYDAEGCGCAVSGVPALWLISAPQHGDLTADTNAFHVYYEERQAVFFEAELCIDYVPATRAFKLKSKQQTYHDGMLILNKIGGQRYEAQQTQ